MWYGYNHRVVVGNHCCAIDDEEFDNSKKNAVVRQVLVCARTFELVLGYADGTHYTNPDQIVLHFMDI